MAPPSQLSIATSALGRLVKDEASYHKELEQQNVRLAKVEGEEGDENKEYMIKQQKQAIEETKAMFPALRKRIGEAMSKLENLLEGARDEGSESNVEEVTKAKETIALAKASYTEAM